MKNRKVSKFGIFFASIWTISSLFIPSFIYENSCIKNNSTINNNVNIKHYVIPNDDTAPASTFITSDSGSVEGTITYNKNDDNHTVEITKGTDISATNFSFKESIKIGDIDYDITSIRARAFTNNQNLNGSITLRDKLLIGAYAFSGCQITKINIGNSNTYALATNIGGKGELLIEKNPTNSWDYTTTPVGCLVCGDIDMSNFTGTTIADDLFGGCAEINSVDLSKCDKLQTIGNRAFRDCSKLVSILFPVSLKTIGESAFVSCNNLLFEPTEFLNIEYIGHTAFRGCNLLKIIYLKNIKSFTNSDPAGKTYPFWDCANLNKIFLGSNITTLPGLAFMCPNLNTLYLNNVKEIKNGLGQNSIDILNLSKVEKITSSILSGQFDRSPSIVYLSKELTEMNYSAFQYFNSLKLISYRWINNQISEIAESGKCQVAFIDSSNMKVIVPHNQKSNYETNKINLGLDAFDFDTQVIETSIDDANSWIKNVKGQIEWFVLDDSKDTIHIYPGTNISGSNLTINQTLTINNHKYSIDGLTDNLFDGNSNLKGSISISKDITKIGSYVFNECNNLNKIYLNWSTNQLDEWYGSGEDKSSIDLPWLGSLNKEGFKIVVPKGAKSIYEKYAIELGINNCTIVDNEPNSPNNNNLPLILGLSLGLGIPAIAGVTTGIIIGIKKYRPKIKKK